MADEKNGVKNGTPNAEMAPQEKDGTKVPLTSDGPGAEVKFTSNTSPNGDAKINVGTTQTFSGLTKEELMQYNDDPFWVRLRWFLFILFWLAWLAMLVVAIVIIVQAERCEPPPELQWIQESPMIEYDSSELQADDLLNVMKNFGISSAYIPMLMSPLAFNELSNNYKNNGDSENPKNNIDAVFVMAKENDMKLVTDFIPRTVQIDHPWVNDHADYFINNTQELDFQNEDLKVTIQEILQSWINKSVTGFLTDDASGMNNTIDDIATTFKESQVVVAGNIVEITEVKVEMLANAENLKEYLEQNTDVWKYFRYNPRPISESINKNDMDLITLGLFMVPGTPILRGGIKNINETDHIKELAKFRQKDAVKFGELTFLNTTENVVAFTRIQKGTPGYAVALNFYNNTEIINFQTVEKVSASGTIEFRLNGDTSKASKVTMKSVELEPHEGLILQFVPDFP